MFHVADVPVLTIFCLLKYAFHQVVVFIGTFLLFYLNGNQKKQQQKNILYPLIILIQTFPKYFL